MEFEDQALVKLEWRSHRHKPSGKDVLVPLLHRPFGDSEHNMEGQCHIGFVTKRQLGIPAGCSQLWWLFAHELTDKLSLNEPLVKTCREPLYDLQYSSRHWYLKRCAAHEGRVLELTFSDDGTKIRRSGIRQDESARILPYPGGGSHHSDQAAEG